MVIEDGSISVDHDVLVVLNKWKKAFEQLLNPEAMQHSNAYEQFEGTQAIHADTSPLNAEVTVEEVRFAVMGAAKGKALGDDNIPVETLQNKVCIQYFVKLFNTCLNAGTIPDSWGKGIINPILKDVKADQREPLNYRGITITSAAYKVNCSILNYRLSNWIEVHNGICDEEMVLGLVEVLQIT